MDTDLFMECEEEELEPWQQVDDRVEEDEMDFMDSYGETADDSPSPLSDSETPPPRTPPPITAPPITAPPITAPTASPLVHVVRPPLPPPLPLPPPSSSSSTPAVAPPLMSQATPLILTQTSGGTFLLPAAPGTHHGSPILFSTQRTLSRTSSSSRMKRENRSRTRTSCPMRGGGQLIVGRVRQSAEVPPSYRSA
ncbi:classical arabinogalactan protein 9-like [Perca fluviatilis]|uniref:classical arabinogalactan protein 9-like n=1 Tax=Perca fluviatilis TaxID=8168 RepID=UPI00196237F7|nr:classical arabinogalactan protein 9-like [Perca fluviatilis]